VGLWVLTPFLWVFFMPNIKNKDKGYISLYRSIQEHYLYPNHRKFTEFEAWVDMLLLANHKEADILIGMQKVKIGRGEFLTSELKLSLRWMWGRDRVRNFLKLLVNDKMIFKNSSSKFTMITICNYDGYQNSLTTKQQQGNNKATTRQQQDDTNNNDNNDNNDNNENKEEGCQSLKTLTEQKNNIEKREREFKESLFPYVEKYGKDMIRKFFDYWTEPNKSKTKMRFEMQNTWDTGRRLMKWASREQNKSQQQQQHRPGMDLMDIEDIEILPL
jgi:hypothetical protein